MKMEKKLLKPSINVIMDQGVVRGQGFCVWQALVMKSVTKGCRKLTKIQNFELRDVIYGRPLSFYWNGSLIQADDKGVIIRG